MPMEQHYLPDPKHLRRQLKPHQRQSLAWMTWREYQPVASGGILGWLVFVFGLFWFNFFLADEMGLGKTVSTISLIVSQKSRERKAPHEAFEQLKRKCARTFVFSTFRKVLNITFHPRVKLGIVCTAFTFLPLLCKFELTL
jgi:SNF2 family DNA or RNA helicase